MLFKQRSYWYIYDFLLDILFLRVVTISCVYPSLWIDIIMIFIYLEPYTLERNYISRWYPFFHDHLVFLVLFLWWLREIVCRECGSYFITSCCTLVWWRLFFLMLVLTRLSPCQLVSLLLTMLSSIGIINWYHSLSSPWLSQALLLLCFFCELVNPFAWCVWEGRVLHLVSHLFKTMLMLNAHPYISLLKCFAMTHTHRFGWAYS